MEIPETLAKLDRWVVWRMENGRKVPYSVWGRRASSTDPQDCSRLRTAIAALGKDGRLGLGFVFHEPDGLVGIDLDDCFEACPAAGELHPGCGNCAGIEKHLKAWARTVVSALVATTYTEVSPSGTGLKAWCRGKIPKALKTTITWGDEQAGAIEVYCRGRYFTFTGQRYDNAPLEIADGQTIIDFIYENLAPERAVTVAEFPAKFVHGEQHNNLVRIVGALRRHNVCEEAIEACLQVVNEHQCEVPGPAANITQLVKSSSEWGHNE